MHGNDVDARSPRTFLLSRIVGDVRVTQRTFDPVGKDFASSALDQLQKIWERTVASLEVIPNSEAATRLNNRYGKQSPDNERLTVHYTDINILADELAGYGPEVLVLSPESLRTAVQDRLRRTVNDHSGVFDPAAAGLRG